MIENIFDAPIPGQSLTDTPGNAAWEHPPEFTDVEKAADYVWDILHKEDFLEQVISFLKDGTPVEAVARMILFGGFTQGKWTPDLAILLAEIVFKQVLAIGMRAKVKNIKLGLKDQSNNAFWKEFAQFKVQKEKTNNKVEDKDKVKKVVEEIKAELETNNSSGLMAKENI